MPDSDYTNSLVAYTAQYDAIWQTGYAAMDGGRVEIDPHLAQREHDRRRGATLLIRPDAPTTAAIASLLAELAAAEPDQHYYRPDELHVTVLSLFTANEHPEPMLARLPEFRAAIVSVLAETPPFRLRFDGLTASPAAVLVQGYPDPATGPGADAGCAAGADSLNALRDRLRTAFAAAGLGDGLDRRYRIATAHMTAMRFRTPPRNLPALLTRLQALRTHPFDCTTVATLHLVENDWYMSHDHLRVVERFGLPFTA